MMCCDTIINAYECYYNTSYDFNIITSTPEEHKVQTSELR